MEYSDLENIEKSYREFGTQKRKMFTLWLHSDPNPSYHKLAKALFLAEETRIATDICRKHGEILCTYLEIWAEWIRSVAEYFVYKQSDTYTLYQD